MYALIVTNYWADLILLTHTERTYVGAVQREVIFDFSPKMQKVRDSELRQFSLLQVSIRGSLYALVLTNYWADLILLTHTERVYVGAVRRKTNPALYDLKHCAPLTIRRRGTLSALLTTTCLNFVKCVNRVMTSHAKKPV